MGAVLVLGLVVLILAESSGPTPTAYAASHTVDMQNFVFAPVSVTITVGDTIRWVNNSGVAHTATDGASGDANAGDQWDHFVSDGSTSPSVTFSAAGTFPYFCELHPPNMKGTIVVNAASTPTPGPTATPAPPTPTPAPTRTPTPTPNITVISDADVKTPPAAGGVVAIVQPAVASRVSLPKAGIEITVPAFARLKTFQLRLSPVDPAALPIPVEGEALRSFAIDLFDETADPIDSAPLGVRATISLPIADSELKALGGLPTVSNDYLTGRIRLQRLSRDGRFWSRLAVSFNSRTRTFTTRLSSFSTFVLVRSSSPAASPAGSSPTPTMTPGPTRVMLAATRDNTLFEDDAGAVSSGSGQHLFVGSTNSGSIRRGLIAFNVAGALPADSSVLGATLTLTMSRTQAGPQTIDLHRLIADWGEGGSSAEGGGGAPATPGDATWVYARYDTEPWTTPGGDFVPGASAGAAVADAGQYSWTSDQMAADVQTWLIDPSSNFGWLLLGNETGSQTTKRFHSGESDTVAGRPILTLEFAPPPRKAPASFAEAPVTGDPSLSPLALTALAILGAASVLAGGWTLRMRRR